MCFLQATKNTHLTLVIGWCFLCEHKYLEKFTKDRASSSRAFLLMQCGTSQQGAGAWAGVHSCCKIRLWNIPFWFPQLHWSKPVLKLAGCFFSRVKTFPSKQLLQCADFVCIVILLSQFYGWYANFWCRYGALAGIVKNKSVLEKFIAYNPDQNSWETCPDIIVLWQIVFHSNHQYLRKIMPDSILA